MPQLKTEALKRVLDPETPMRPGSSDKPLRRNRENADDYAAYAFDMLQSLREASTQERHAFLRYLMGMAAEEAIRLAEGQPSAAAAYTSRTK